MRNLDRIIMTALITVLLGVLPCHGEGITFENHSTVTVPDVHATCEDALFNPDYGVFADEGGFQNSAHDTGNFYQGKNCGGTKYGIACGFNMGWLRTIGVPIKDITKAQATERYKKGECAEIHIEKFKGRRNPAMLLGLAVNQGSGLSALELGEVRNAVRRMHKLDPLPVSTAMTDDLITWYNDFTADPDHRQQVLFALSLMAIDRATDIVDANPRQAANLMAWVTRWNPLNFRMPTKVKKTAEAVKKPAVKKPVKRK